MKNLPYEQIAKYLAGEATEAETKELQQWIKEHPNEMLEMTAIWEKTNRENKFSDVDTALTKVNSQIDKLENEQGKNKFTKKNVFYALGIAASIVILFTALNITNILNWNKSETENYVAITTSEKETKDVVLPDGSTIKLNNESSIRYARDFQTNRDLYLEGEAFFDVAPDPQHPFTIHTNNTEVQVLGTSFGIRALDMEDEVIVTVATGTVSFSDANKMIEVKLNKGEQAVYKSESKKIKKNETLDPNYLAWQTKVLQFKNTPMTQVAKLTGEIYHTSINVDPSVQDLQLTSTFEKLDIDQVIEIIELTLDIKAEKRGNEIFFTKK